VYVERENGGSALKWLLLGAAVGAGLALLFAPRSGADLRQDLRRGVRRLKHLAEDSIDDLRGEFGREEREARAMADSGSAYGEPAEKGPADSAAGVPAAPSEAGVPAVDRPTLTTAREELERRLAAARARRRQTLPEHEEPVA
jgi:hypothetical protein